MQKKFQKARDFVTELLHFIPDSVYHLFCVFWYFFWHFCIHDDKHITRFSIRTSSFSGDFKLCSRFCSGFYLERERFSIYSFDGYLCIIEKIKEWYFDRFSDIEVWYFFFLFCSWLFSLGLLSSSSATKKITNIKFKSSLSSSHSPKSSKYIFKSRKIGLSSCCSLSSSKRVPATHSSKWISFCRTKLIIVFLLFLVAKYLIGFINFFEFFFSFRISFISVRMVFHGFLFVCFFYLCFSCRF